MKKDYATWHAYKSRLNSLQIVTRFGEWEVWYGSLGLNVGDEEDGKNELFERPIIVIRKFSNTFFVGLPLTSTVKAGKFYYPITLNNKRSFVILSQIRSLDARRLRRRIGVISKEDESAIMQRLLILLASKRR